MRAQVGLLGGRLLAMTLLLGGALLLGRDETVGELVFDTLRVVIGSTYITALAVAILLPRIDERRVVYLAWAQVAWDLGVVTCLVYLLGGAGSGFSFLYGVIILAAALVIGTRASVVTSAVALTLYIGVGLGLANGWIESLPTEAGLPVSEVPPDEVALSVLRNFVGLMLVGLLAGILAERIRRTGGQLREVRDSARGIERLNQDILRSLRSGLLITDLDGHVTEINPAGARLLGGGVEDLVSKKAADLLPLGDPDETSSERLDGVAHGVDGRQFPVGFSVSPLRDGSDHVRGTLVLFQDLTELSALREKAERAERLAALGRLSASLAHEIRNPLSSISGSVEMVQEAEQLPEEDRRLLQLVLGEVDRLNDLVSTMLDVGRPRALEPTSIDLGALANEVANVASQTSSSGPEIQVRSPADPVRVTADAAQLRQVLWNLVKNAIQFSNRDGTIDIEVGWDEESCPTISVRDSGPGIADDDLEHLFEMFYSKRHHGVGLGLALVRQIVDAHRGSISVESELGEGTTFTVHLPRDHLPRDHLPRDHPPQEGAAQLDNQERAAKTTPYTSRS